MTDSRSFLVISENDSKHLLLNEQTSIVSQRLFTERRHRRSNTKLVTACTVVDATGPRRQSCPVCSVSIPVFKTGFFLIQVFDVLLLLGTESYQDVIATPEETSRTTAKEERHSIAETDKIRMCTDGVSTAVAKDLDHQRN